MIVLFTDFFVRKLEFPIFLQMFPLLTPLSSMKLSPSLKLCFYPSPCHNSLFPPPYEIFGAHVWAWETFYLCLTYRILFRFRCMPKTLIFSFTEVESYLLASQYRSHQNIRVYPVQDGLLAPLVLVPAPQVRSPHPDVGRLWRPYPWLPPGRQANVGA